MYCEYYGLIRRPFEMTPDPAFLYLGEAHREGLAMLQYAVESRKGFVMLTGEVGTGKTTLLHSLLSQLDSRTNSAFVFNPRLKPIDFFKVVFDEFGIEEPCRTKGEYLMALNRFLIEKLEQDEPVLLIVDEAQNLSAEMLEEIRLLSNLETPTSKLLQIMLVGQPELKEMLTRPDLRQLRQRIVLRHHLRPFNGPECASYIDERLRLAGYTDKALFDRGALKEIHERTGGIPRLVNIVCDGALLLGFSRELHQIDRKAIAEVAGDLDLGSGPRSAEENETSGATPRRRRGLFGLFPVGLGRQEKFMGKVYDALRKAEGQRARRVEAETALPGHEWERPIRAREQRKEPFWRRLFSRGTPAAVETPDQVGAPNKRRISMLQPDSYVAEQFRSLRARLDSISQERPICTITMTSARKGEGKTIAAVNFALVTAMSVGRRVLLVDCDMREPQVHRTLGLRPETGLAEVLTEQASLDDAIIKVDGINLEVLPVRALPPNPSELLASPKMRTVMEELARNYDTVVLDSPCTLGVPDAKSISELTDGMLFVVRADKTPEEEVEAALDILDRRRILGLVLNDAQVASTNPYTTPS